MAERAPHPSVITHGDGHGDLLLDRMLTEQERTNDLLELLLDRLPAPASAPAAGAGPVEVDIREPQSQATAVALAEPAPRKTTAKRAPKKET